MNDDLISRQAVIDLIMENDPFWCEGMTRTIFDGIDRLPSVDAVPVIRCKECKWYYRGGATCMYWDGENNMSGDDYCSQAERKEE